MLAAKLTTLRVLVVDDHELTRFSLKIALKRQENIELVGLASDGQEAVELTKQTHPDIVILDMQMPVMDGATASHHIKRFNSSIKIIGYSSLTGSHSKELVDAAQLDAFCDKSTPANQLIKLAWELSEC